MKKIRKGDSVIVIAGKDKGKQSTVIRFQSTERVIVREVNKVKSHIKPNPNRNIAGGIVETEKPLHISNIAIFNPEKTKLIEWALDLMNQVIKYGILNLMVL